MKFRDFQVFHEEKFTIGVEEESQKYYVSIPVSNGVVKYSEYYEISPEEFESAISSNTAAIKNLVGKCRLRLCDDRLMEKPSRFRGRPI